MDLCLYDGRGGNYGGSGWEAFVAVGHPFKQVRAPRGLYRNFLRVRPEAELTVDGKAQDFHAVTIRNLEVPQSYGVFASFPTHSQELYFAGVEGKALPFGPLVQVRLGALHSGLRALVRTAYAQDGEVVYIVEDARPNWCRG